MCIIILPYSRLTFLQLSRELVLSGLEALLAPPTPQFIAHVGMCHIQNHRLDDSMDSDDMDKYVQLYKKISMIFDSLGIYLECMELKVTRP